jgi:hypothetical protein
MNRLGNWVVVVFFLCCKSDQSELQLMPFSDCQQTARFKVSWLCASCCMRSLASLEWLVDLWMKSESCLCADVLRGRNAGDGARGVSCQQQDDATQ